MGELRPGEWGGRVNIGVKIISDHRAWMDYTSVVGSLVRQDRRQ